MAETMIKNAVKAAKELREAALEAAKNELLEEMSPKLMALVEGRIKQTLSESSDRTSGAASDYEFPRTDAHKKFEEGAEQMDKDLELESMFAEASDDASEEVEELEEAHAEPDGDECAAGEEEEVEEGISLSTEELRRVYEAALQVEASVKRGFGEQSAAGELDEVDPNAGALDVKSGEHFWEKETPPDAKDMTIKEMIKRGLAENKALRLENKKLKAKLTEAATKLQEVNLFNSKVLHVNKIFNENVRLSSDQRKVVVESIDKARSVDQVKAVYGALKSAFTAADKLVESRTRKPVANAQGARKGGSSDAKVISESADKSASGTRNTRWAELAGLVK